MSNNSATGGILVPAGTMPLDDSALDDAIQGLIVGITGIDGTLVRPLYNNPPLPEPEFNVNWMAVGIAEADDVGYPSIIHTGGTATADGYDTLTQNEELRFLVASFGPLGSRLFDAAT